MKPAVFESFLDELKKLSANDNMLMNQMPFQNPMGRAMASVAAQGQVPRAFVPSRQPAVQIPGLGGPMSDGRGGMW